MAKTKNTARLVPASPPLDPQLLSRRLSCLRRRLWLIVTFRGFSWLLVLVCATALLVGLLDWRVHLPSLVRAIALVGLLSGAGYVFFRYLFQPLADKADDLTLALRIEEKYPALNDSLASTIQFLNEGDKPEINSPALRREAVRRALKRAQGCDFGRIINARGLRAASALLLVAGAACCAILLLYPQLAYTALVRLVAPFSDVDWPRQTRLEMDTPRERIGRNEAFEVKGIVRGVVPETATVLFRIDSGTQVEHVYEIGQGSEPGTGSLTVHLEPGRARSQFSFEIHANDAVYRSRTILVSPPPMLTSSDGRPSPLVHLDFPAYTDLPPQDLPDGSGNVEAVAGSSVTLRAAADRSLRAAWIEFVPETRFADLSAFLAPLGVNHPGFMLTATAGGQTVWDVVPATLEGDRRRFSVRFWPRTSGMYALHFEDETGLANSRLFELRVFADPPPTVTLERPSPTRDLLDMLPDADLPMQALVTDPQYAVRSVYLEYRTKKTLPPREAILWDHHTAGLATAWSLASLAGPRPAVGMESIRTRLIRVPINQAVSLRRFHHPDGSPLREGDVLTLQLCADDFDDVTVDKQSGRSHEIEIHIINRNALEVVLNQEEAKVQQDLLRLEKLQQEAKKKVQDTQNQMQKSGKLQSEDVTRLLDAEQQQQQIRERVGDRQEGLRSEVSRILDTLKNNKLPRSGTHERMERVQGALDRLAREELPQIEPRLTNARKEAENQENGIQNKQPAQKEEAAREKEKEARVRARQAQDQENAAAEAEKQAESTPDGDSKKEELKKEAKQARQAAERMRQESQQLQKQADAIRRGEKPDAIKDSLKEAKQHQEEVEKTLAELLQALDPFASTAAIKGEAKSLLEEQKRVNQETEKYSDQNRDSLGDDRNELKESQKAQLDKLQEDQKNLQDRMGKLLRQMEQVRDKRREEKDQDTAKQLDQAIEQANKGNLAGRMEDARKQIESNRTMQAGKTQRETIDEMKKLVEKLEDRREAELDRLAKKLREKQDQLEDLAQQQEKLQKEVQQARQIADPKAREEALKKLARRQKELKEQAEELARQLSRMRQEHAGQAASQAAGQMEQALKQLERGQDPDEEQDEALDRLDEAQREVERAKEETEEELAREQAAKAAEEIKRLKQRHETLMAEAAAIERAALQEKHWRDSLLRRLTRLGDNQKELGEETADLGEKKLAQAQVFGRLLQKTADVMRQAGASFKERARRGNEEFDDVRPDEQGPGLQQEALRRLDQLLEALKTEPGAVMRPAGNRGGGGGEGGAGGGGDEGLPPLVQYKLLRSLQAEVNQRTEEFARKHPDASRLTERDQAELQGLRREQKEIADLLDELAQPAEEGGQP